MRERFTLRAWPLTPIHVGSGLELTPESFVLDGDRLKSFNPFGALSRASEAQREQYGKLLKNGDFVGAQKLLGRLAMAESGTVSPGVRVSGNSLRDLERVLDGQSLGKGGVRPMVRDGETPILPGSSLKGAFRTAWIAARFSENAARSVMSKVRQTRTKEAAVELNERALDIDHGVLEQDPFRDVAIADVKAPVGRTRFDRATLGKRDKDRPVLDFGETEKMQMHVECLDSLADGGAAPELEIDVDVLPAALAFRRAEHGTREDRKGHGSKRIVPRTPIAAQALWAAVNSFHADLWRYERHRFYGAGPAAAMLERLLGAFGLKGDEALADQLNRAGLVLLRVGRYSQFESKAVKVGGERHGLKARTFSRQTGESVARLMDQGGTRTAIQVAPGLYAPFGWLMLALPGKGPQGAVHANVSDLARTAAPPAASRIAPGPPAAPAPVQATAALAGKFKFRKGDRVVHPDQGEAIVLRDVGQTDRMIDVDFGDESGEWPVDGWTKA